MSLDGDIELLSRVPLFADLSSDQLRLLAFSADRRQLAPGQALFERGGTAQSGFVVVTGMIELYNEVGGERRILAICEYGSLIGEIALFIETTRPANAVAVVESTVLELSRTLVMRMLGEYPHIALRLRAVLSERLAATLRDLDPLTAGWADKPR